MDGSMNPNGTLKGAAMMVIFHLFPRLMLEYFSGMDQECCEKVVNSKLKTYIIQGMLLPEKLGCIEADTMIMLNALC